jgi:glycosyltransferase involved in cell wall biosynthesis
MYNEAANAEACVHELSSFLEGVSTRTAIIAVNDGSSDGTLEELNSLTLKI